MVSSDLMVAWSMITTASCFNASIGRWCLQTMENVDPPAVTSMFQCLNRQMVSSDVTSTDDNGDYLEVSMPQSADGVFRHEAFRRVTQHGDVSMPQSADGVFRLGVRWWLARGSCVSMPQSADGVFRPDGLFTSTRHNLFQCLNRQMVSSDS